jgi:hypothetical protein
MSHPLGAIMAYKIRKSKDGEFIMTDSAIVLTGNMVMVTMHSGKYSHNIMSMDNWIVHMENMEIQGNILYVGDGPKVDLTVKYLPGTRLHVRNDAGFSIHKATVLNNDIVLMTMYDEAYTSTKMSLVDWTIITNGNAVCEPIYLLK